MAVIQAGYNCKIDKTQKIAVVVNAAEKIYADMFQQETLRCEVWLVPVTVQRLINSMNKNYRLKGGGNSGNNYKNGQDGNFGNDGHKTALIGADRSVGKQYYNCGKGGHWARDCPKRRNNDGKRNCFDGTCHECGTYGHNKADCWGLSKNAHKRPHNWVSREKCANVASASIEDDMANDYFVANIDFGEINICKGIKEMDFFDEELITGQDGPGIRVTGQDGPGTKV